MRASILAHILIAITLAEAAAVSISGSSSLSERAAVPGPRFANKKNCQGAGEACFGKRDANPEPEPEPEPQPEARFAHKKNCQGAGEACFGKRSAEAEPKPLAEPGFANKKNCQGAGEACFG